MSDSNNFHVIQSTDELPAGACSAISIFVRNSYEAEQYAHAHPERTIYWIESRRMGVWYSPLRRQADLPRVLA